MKKKKEKILKNVSALGVAAVIIIGVAAVTAIEEIRSCKRK